LLINRVGFKLTAQAFHHLPFPGQPDKVILGGNVQRRQMVSHRLLAVPDHPGDVELTQMRQIILVRCIANGHNRMNFRAYWQFCYRF
jgi:hypothetical protein